MKKRLSALLLAVCMLLSFVPTAAFAEGGTAEITRLCGRWGKFKDGTKEKVTEEKIGECINRTDSALWIEADDDAYFRGWTTDVEAYNKLYEPTEELPFLINDMNYKVQGRDTIYAVMSRRTYVIVKYHPGIGGNCKDNEGYCTDRIVTLFGDSEDAVETTEHITPKQPSYEFKGWTTDSTAGGKLYAEGEALPEFVQTITTKKYDEGTIDLYAVWVTNDFNGDGIDDCDQKTVITYTSGVTKMGGKEEKGIVTGLPESETVTWKRLGENEYSIPVSTKIPVRNGFVFDGWTKEAGYDPVYDAQSHAVIDAIEPAEKTTMTALWKSPTGKQAELYYYVGIGGTRPNNSFSEYIPAEFDYTPHTPQELGIKVDDGLVFLGWSESNDKEVISQVYGTNDSVPDLVTTVNVADGGRKQLTALYGLDSNNNGIADLNEEKLTVSFDMNAEVLAGAAPVKPIKAVDGEQAELPRNVTPNQTGVCWVGWSPVQITKMLTKDDPRPEVINELTVTKNTTLYAVWGEDTNLDNIPDVGQMAAVTYEAPGAQNVPEPQKVMGKMLYIPGSDGEPGHYMPGYPLDPQIPTMEGKVFDGWQWKEENTFYSRPGDDYIILQTINWPDITLVARWRSPEKPSAGTPAPAPTPAPAAAPAPTARPARPAKPGYENEAGPAAEATPAVKAPEISVQLPESASPEERKAAEEVAEALNKGSQIIPVVETPALEKAAGQMAAENVVTMGEARNALIDALNPTRSQLNNTRVVVETYMDIQLVLAESDESFTLNITPMAKTIATFAGSGNAIRTEGRNANAVVMGAAQKFKITEPVTITLPLPAAFAEAKTLFVEHLDYVYTGRISNEGDRSFLSFENPHGFSEFTVQRENRAAAQIGEMGYLNLDAAVREVADGETINLLKTNADTLTVDRQVAFTFAGEAFTGTVNAADGLECTVDGSTYTVAQAVPQTDAEDPAAKPEAEAEAEAGNSHSAGLLWSLAAIAVLVAAVLIFVLRKKKAE